jgi:hypothetical protein
VAKYKYVRFVACLEMPRGAGAANGREGRDGYSDSCLEVILTRKMTIARK